MTKLAIVADVSDTGVSLLSLDRVEQEHDKMCAVDSSCHQGCGCRVSGRPFRAALPRNFVVDAGDTVEVQSSALRALGASLLIFGLPLVLGFSAWFIAEIKMSTEAVQVMGTLVAALLGLGFVVWLGSRKSKETLPEIISVLEKTGRVCSSCS